VIVIEGCAVKADLNPLESTFGILLVFGGGVLKHAKMGDRRVFVFIDIEALLMPRVRDALQFLADFKTFFLHF
jgi:hypothetical protein